MELNKEQIIKALECCSSSDDVYACKSGCPYWGGDYDTCLCIEDPNFITKNALSLIKELTEENERLRAEKEVAEIYNKDLKYRNNELTAFNRRWAKECDDLQDECDQIKADTVRKMQERLKSCFEDDVKYDGFRIAIWIDQIAEEIINGSD